MGQQRWEWDHDEAKRFVRLNKERIRRLNRENGKLRDRVAELEAELAEER